MNTNAPQRDEREADRMIPSERFAHIEDGEDGEHAERDNRQSGRESRPDWLRSPGIGLLQIGVERGRHEDAEIAGMRTEKAIRR